VVIKAIEKTDWREENLPYCLLLCWHTKNPHLFVAYSVSVTAY
jgi:hypothetical protein